ncbi:OmpA family protein [Constantimarinum furrinae]|uniref:Outer membrane protein n=1 Tax=Constantimarinum furrinae TaxID=2562285 RepID=A0A7G8PQK0_9FLAO|nr:OmpA family protein [Constantimarinum furrinae]QNJ96616.1 Outer membrane protein [Constantimarinum furrinae]
MRICPILILITILFSASGSTAQEVTGKSYKIDRYKSIYLPLGTLSFADSIVHFRLGFPEPLQKYTDSSQCLHEPNYKRYQDPNFLSLGCGGTVTVAFTDNGFMNLPGDDLYVFEVGPSREPASIEISENGTDWFYAGKIDGGKSVIDLADENISTETVFYFVRVTDLKNLCKSKSAGADIDAIAAITSVIKLSINADVLFDVDEFTLKETASNTLDTLVATIQKVDKATLLIEGHTDSDGTDAYNKTLSENRCYTVVDRIRALLGFEANYDYEIRAFGETRPKVLNDSEENKQINRRVEITVLPPKSYFESLKNKD